MRNRELWKRMDELADQVHSESRDLEFIKLLKTAYDEDMGLIMACIRTPNTAREGYSAFINQAYIESDGEKFMICYTSSEHAKRETRRADKFKIGWVTMRARDVMNNMFNQKDAGALIFNPENEKMVIIFKSDLEQIMPGPKPKPPLFRDNKQGS